MPRYLLDVQRTAPVDRGGSASARWRFPEIAVEHRYVTHDRIGRELWVCRAPSAAHVERWAEAAPLELRSLRQIVETHAHQEEPR